MTSDNTAIVPFPSLFHQRRNLMHKAYSSQLKKNAGWLHKIIHKHIYIHIHKIISSGYKNIICPTQTLIFFNKPDLKPSSKDQNTYIYSLQDCKGQPEEMVFFFFKPHGWRHFQLSLCVKAGRKGVISWQSGALTEPIRPPCWSGLGEATKKGG